MSVTNGYTEKIYFKNIYMRLIVKDQNMII